MQPYIITKNSIKPLQKNVEETKKKSPKQASHNIVANEMGHYFNKSAEGKTIIYCGEDMELLHGFIHNAFGEQVCSGHRSPDVTKGHATFFVEDVPSKEKEWGIFQNVLNKRRKDCLQSLIIFTIPAKDLPADLLRKLKVDMVCEVLHEKAKRGRCKFYTRTYEVIVQQDSNKIYVTKL